MRFNSYTISDNYYEFEGDNGLKLIIPSTDIILVDDESGLFSIKLIASRKTIGLVPK